MAWCRQLFNYINLLADISHYPINHVIFRYIYEYREMLLGNFKEDSSHSTVKTYGGLGKLRSSPQWIFLWPVRSVVIVLFCQDNNKWWEINVCRDYLISTALHISSSVQHKPSFILIVPMQLYDVEKALTYCNSWGTHSTIVKVISPF